jgi:hypothetical protein
MVFKLAAHCAFNGPVSRIVDAGRHLVGEQLPVTGEKFHRQYADVVEVLQNGLHVATGL